MFKMKLYDLFRKENQNQSLYNRTVQNFLERNNIDPNLVSKNIDTKIKMPKDQSPILAKYQILKQGEYGKNVSIGDIYGLYDERGSIYEMLNYFFDSEGDDYLRRSCHKLTETPEMMMESDSFIKEPIVLINLNPQNNVYFVFTNGKHRFLTLKALYLKEVADNPQNINIIKDKYTIPATVYDVDIIKSYCNFIIQICNKGYIIAETNAEFQKTGNCKLINNLNEEILLTDRELLEYIRKLYFEYSYLFDEYLEKDYDFYKFIENYVDIKENNYARR